MNLDDVDVLSLFSNIYLYFLILYNKNTLTVLGNFLKCVCV